MHLHLATKAGSVRRGLELDGKLVVVGDREADHETEVHMAASVSDNRMVVFAHGYHMMADHVAGCTNLCQVDMPEPVNVDQMTVYSLGSDTTDREGEFQMVGGGAGGQTAPRVILEAFHLSISAKVDIDLAVYTMVRDLDHMNACDGSHMIAGAAHFFDLQIGVGIVRRGAKVCATSQCMLMQSHTHYCPPCRHLTLDR